MRKLFVIQNHDAPRRRTRLLLKKLRTQLRAPPTYRHATTACVVPWPQTTTFRWYVARDAQNSSMWNLSAIRHLLSPRRRTRLKLLRNQLRVRPTNRHATSPSLALETCRRHFLPLRFQPTHRYACMVATAGRRIVRAITACMAQVTCPHLLCLADSRGALYTCAGMVMTKAIYV